MGGRWRHVGSELGGAVWARRLAGHPRPSASQPCLLTVGEDVDKHNGLAVLVGQGVHRAQRHHGHVAGAQLLRAAERAGRARRSDSAWVLSAQGRGRPGPARQGRRRRASPTARLWHSMHAGSEWQSTARSRRLAAAAHLRVHLALQVHDGKVQLACTAGQGRAAAGQGLICAGGAAAERPAAAALLCEHRPACWPHPPSTM